MNNDQKITAINSFREENELKLLDSDGVIGVGTGLKEVNGIITDELCLRVYVQKKTQPSLLSASALLPKTLSVNGAVIPTDVVEAGDLVPLAYVYRERPAPNGVSLGTHGTTLAGTKGLMVKDNISGKTVILSNNHVLANYNQSPLGSLILQPAAFDGGVSPEDAIAKLHRFVPLGSGRDNYNRVDAAIAMPIDGNLVNNKMMCTQFGDTDAVVGLLFTASGTMALVNHISHVQSELNITVTNPTAVATLGMFVYKCGRITEYTTAKVSDINATFKLQFPIGEVYFSNQVVVTGMFAVAGDSGAAVFVRR
jgi:hypothetical protein